MNDIVNRLRTNRECLAPCLMDEAADTIERLTAERDEARRIACNNAANYNSMMFDNPKQSDPRAIAESHGWDCFKEDGE